MKQARSGIYLLQRQVQRKYEACMAKHDEEQAASTLWRRFGAIARKFATGMRDWLLFVDVEYQREKAAHGGRGLPTSGIAGDNVGDWCSKTTPQYPVHEWFCWIATRWDTTR